MDLNSYFLNEHSRIFVETRLQSSERYSGGTGSVVVAMIGRLATALGRAATTVEGWANGPEDASAQSRRPATSR
jgi:hypothetical protein